MKTKRKHKIKPNVQKLTRREIRKQKLQQKKENKRLFFSNKTQGKQLVDTSAAAAQTNILKTKKPKKYKSNNIQQLMKVITSDNESIASDFSDAEVDALLTKNVQAVTKHCTGTGVRKTKMPERPNPDNLHARELKRQKELKSAADKQRIKQLRTENKEEDRLMHSLEKRLKLNRSRDKQRLVRKMYSVDGLDWALELCLDDDSDRKRDAKKSKQQQQHVQCDSDDDVLSNINSDDDHCDEINEYLDNLGVGEQSERKAVENQDFTEDIYGRKRDRHGNIIKDEMDATETTQKYIPPHRRTLLENKIDEIEQKSLERLRKNCKGLLNRLSETNLHKIANGIEDLYMQNSRYSMNQTLGDLLKEALVASAQCNERMLQEHMVLLAYLHAHIGTEIGAYFVQLFMQQFDNYMQQLNTLDVADKRLNNVVLLLSYMYMFRIYEHKLMLEIIDKLTFSLCEKTVECLLLIYQSVGLKLRKDDPLAFKQMLVTVQQRASRTTLDMQRNLRLKFMVEVLHALKNNNLHKLPNVDPQLPEQLRKRLKGILRTDKYVTTLNIAMSDLLRADQVGKWWIVGSAWSGNITDLGAAQTLNPSSEQEKKKPERSSDKILALARAQHMNTDERRQIFCLIMSAENCIDAFEKILQLALKDQRTIAYIVIHCCLHERAVNPYYAHLALKFIKYNRKYQLAFQFASWDRINDINLLHKCQIRNFAQFLIQLIARGGLALTVLKSIDFVQLNKSSFALMQQIMLGLLLWPNGEGDISETDIKQLFERVARNTKFVQFKNRLRLFIQHFLLQRLDETEQKNFQLNSEQIKFLRQRCEIIDNVLAYIDL